MMLPEIDAKPFGWLLLGMIMASCTSAAPLGSGSGVHAVSIEAEGLSIHAQLYPANDPGAGPAVVLLHGWTWPDQDPSRGMAAAASEFQQSGYTVLVPAMRGWPQSGGVDDCGGRQVADTLRMLEWLGRQPGVNADARFLVGYSQGGQVALLAAGLDAPVKAVAAFAPVVDPGSWGEDTDVRGIRDYVMDECGGPEGWQSRNVMNRIANLRRPLLLVHGDDDRRVPTRQSTRLYNRLKALGRPVQLKLIPGAGHDQRVVLRPQLAIKFFENTGAPSD